MEDEKSKQNSLSKEILSWIIDIGIVLVIVWIITSFIAQKTNVIGQSMEPTLHHGDHVIIDKISYRVKEPDRFDIIVFPFQQNPEQNYIKRIIGLPGEEININDGCVYIDGEPLEEIKELELIANQGSQTYPLLVPKGQYFVMGDNRNNSKDSRFIDVGTIPKSDIVGKALLRIWPLKDFGVVN